MPKKSIYINIDESTPEVARLIRDVVLFIEFWIKTKKTVVPKKEILIEMKIKGKSEIQINYVIGILLDRKFIRKAVSSNKTSFVQIGTARAYIVANS